jgi:hypothetical protein
MAINAEQLNIILSARDKEFTKAMERNQRRVERFASRSNKSLSTTEKSMKALTKAAKAFAPILAGAFAIRGISRLVDSAAAIKDLANIAGVGVVEFQKLAAAAKTVGIEQDKMSDILKDVNDKFGDFFQTGAGPLADFFEQIAPKVNLTADRFKALSGPQALGLYVAALEKANLSQAEMTFFMEAIASDSTALLPLLRNNGQLMRELGEEAENMGRILNEDAVEGAKNLQTEFDNLRASMGTAIQSALLDNADEILAIVEKFTDEILPKVIGFTEKLLGMSGGAQPSPEDIARDRLDTQTTPEEEASEGSVPRIFEESGGKPALPALLLMTPEEYEEYLALMGGGGDDAVRPRSRPRGLKGRNRDAAKNLDEQAQRVNRLSAAYDDLKAALDPVVAAEMELADNERIVIDAFSAGVITGDEKAQMLDRLMQSYHDATLEATGLADAMQGVQYSLESAFMGIIDGTTSASDAFRSMARDIIAELYRVLVVQQLVGSFEAGGGGILGSVFGSLSGRASGGAVMAGSPYMVGESGPEPFIPAQNGRILSVAQAKDAIGGGGSGVTVVQNNNFGSGVTRQDVAAMLPAIVETTKAAVFDAQRRSVNGRGYA